MSETKYKQLTKDKRKKLQELYEAGFTPKEIAGQLGIHYSTVYRELKRGRTDDNTYSYSYEIAQKEHDSSKKNCGPRRKIKEDDEEFIEFVEKKILKEKYTPAEVIKYMNEHKTDFEAKDNEICLATLYKYIKAEMFPNLTMKELPGGGEFFFREEDYRDMSTAGHWKMEIIESPYIENRALLLLSENGTDNIIVNKMERKTQEEVISILNRIEKRFGARKFRERFKSISVDKREQFSDEAALVKSCLNKTIPRTKIFYNE